ncbi:MAG: nucleoside deaminase [Cellulophaga sp.]|nr:nucleoside deaminase [Cellulophaga sp.]
MTNEHLHFMRRAIFLAREGKAKGNGAFGAVIVKNNKIIAEGHNVVTENKDCTQHAELSVIQKACNALDSKTLKGCTLYTSCIPCMMCLGASYWAKIEAIYYGASAKDAKDFGFIYTNMYYAYSEENRTKEFNLIQLLRDEAIAVWTE